MGVGALPAAWAFRSPSSQGNSEGDGDGGEVGVLTRTVIGFPQAFEDLIRRTLTSTLQGVHEIWRSVHSEGKANYH